MGRKKEDKAHFTGLELEILTLLSDRGRGSVHDVFDHIAKERAITQPSINSTVSAMVKKGMLDVVNERRPQLYAPAKRIKAQYQAELKHVAKRFFGAKSDLVLGLLFGRSTAAERAEAKKIIEEMD